jgi:hypothetical protein
MGFFDKVKEKAAEAIEQGKDVAQTQQLKVQLKRLQAEEEEALSAFGNAAFTMWESGSLSMSSDLGEAAARIRDVRAQIEAKKAEIAEAGGKDDDDKGGTRPEEPVAAGTANTSQQAPPAMPEL